MAVADDARVRFQVDGIALEGRAGEPLIDAILRNGIDLPHVCYTPSLGPLESCDSCLVSVSGQIVRACSAVVREGAEVGLSLPRLAGARAEAVRRLAESHHFRCTLCDNNNGDCRLHEAARSVGLDHQEYRPKPYPLDETSPFYRYDPNQCILCGRCVEACQDLVVI